MPENSVFWDYKLACRARQIVSVHEMRSYALLADSGICNGQALNLQCCLLRFSPARVFGDLQLLLATMHCFMAFVLEGLTLISRNSHIKSAY